MTLEPPARRGPGVVTVLASVLTLLVLIWVVGTVLLVRYADDLPSVGPSPSASPTATRNR
jgi:hypothetical protein